MSGRRFLSHLVFDFLLLFYLIRQAFRYGRPRTILTTLPHNGAACVAVLFARAVGARLVVDVHDTWPESILSVVKLTSVTRIAYVLWKTLADFALASADDVFAESVRYAERANGIRDRFRRPRARTIYLGGDLAYYQGMPPVAVLPEEVRGASFLVCYVGTLGMNYDLDCVIEAYAAFERECPEAGLLLLGAGERELDIKAKLSRLHLNCWVSGRIAHPILLGYLKRSHVGLNCFKQGGNVAYSYKLNDYLLSGVPVINSLTGEAADLVSAHDLGMNYAAGDPQSLLDALRACRVRWRVDTAWRQKVTAFSARVLDRRASYRPLVERCLGATATDSE